jgi:hypothetical protein
MPGPVDCNFPTARLILLAIVLQIFLRSSVTGFDISIWSAERQSSNQPLEYLFR